MAHCKITTQLSQTMLGSASHYRDYVQCQSQDWDTWHTCFNIQRVQDRIHSPNNGEYEFWFCHDDIKCYVSGSMKKYVLDWPIAPNTWPVKISSNLSKNEVVTFEDVGFQLQQREVLSPRHRFSTIATFPIPHSHFYTLSKPDAHLTFMPRKTVCRNPTTSMVDYNNKWKSVGFMEVTVVGVTVIPYLGFGVIIKIVSKQDITYHVTRGDIPLCTCPDFTKMSSQTLGKKGKWMYCKYF